MSCQHNGTEALQLGRVLGRGQGEGLRTSLPEAQLLKRVEAGVHFNHGLQGLGRRWGQGLATPASRYCLACSTTCSFTIAAPHVLSVSLPPSPFLSSSRFLPAVPLSCCFSPSLFPFRLSPCPLSFPCPSLSHRCSSQVGLGGPLMWGLCCNQNTRPASLSLSLYLFLPRFHPITTPHPLPLSHPHSHCLSVASLLPPPLFLSLSLSLTAPPRRGAWVVHSCGGCAAATAQAGHPAAQAESHAGQT